MDDGRSKFLCTFTGCNRAYFRREHLNRHALTHEDKSSAFQCNLCQRKFTRNDLLHAHLRRHENRSRTIPQGAAATSYTDQSETHSLEVRSSPSRRLSSPEGWNVRDQRRDTQARSTSGTAVLQDLTPNDQSIPADTQPTSYLADTTAEDEYAWLFREASLFDLPSDDYLNLHFSGGISTGSPDPILQALEPSPLPREYELSQADHRRMIDDCPDVVNTALEDIKTASSALIAALEYCEIYMPLFHRPTFDLSSCPALLLLPLCLLGMFLNHTNGAFQTGRMLQKHIWRTTLEKALLSPGVEMCVLQTIVVLEHVCTYTLSRQEHEMAEIVHGMVVTLARRNNLMAAVHYPEHGPQQLPDMKWREWVQRESAIRLAHTIFVHDVQYAIHFTHHITLSVGMMKLPLPSPQMLWQAKTSNEWESEMRQIKTSNRAQYYSLQTSVESLMCMRNSDLNRDFYHRFDVSNPSAVHLLIHGITSALADNKYRNTESSSSPATRFLKQADFDEALAQWRAIFDELPTSNKGSRLSWNALLMYHFACVLLHNNISDIQMAAGSAFAFGRGVTPQRAQISYTRLITTEPVSHETYLHGLEVVRLCLQDVEFHEPYVTGRPSIEQSRPLWQTYCAFLGVLVLWAHTLGLERLGHANIDSTPSFRPLLRISPLTSAKPSRDATTLTETLGKMFDREMSRSETDRHEVEIIKNDVRQLIGIVRENMAGSSWDISHEGRRILASLAEKGGAMS